MPEIRVIEPIIFAPAEKLRVCAYARVSSDSTDQRNSFASQVNYYTKYIQAHEGWTFVDIYADQGITGTSALKRDEFLRLMRDCRQGKIDRILVKSVSRFARNAQDCIEAVRELRQLGVTVYFEKEHINTANMSNEMFLSMMSAFAQEESISISKNMRKGAVMRMKNGTFRLSQAPYGYYLDEKGILIVQQEESKIVQRIFGNFLSGMGIQEIAAELQKEHIPKLNGEPIWSYTGILYKAMIARILDCEKYISEEFPAILPSDLFLQVQRLRKDRAQIYGGSLNPALRGIRDLICCQTCGQKLVRINHRDNVYIIWKCPSCNTETRYLPDIELMSSVLSAINRAIEDPQKVMNFKKNANCLSVQAVRLENEIYRELGNPKSNSKRLLEIIKQCAQEKYKACHANGDSEETECLIAELKKLQPMEHFQSQILRKFICKILITPAGAVTIQLKNGAII